MCNRRCYLGCRDHLCSSRIPGLGLRRICPRFLGPGLCTLGSADARTLGCRLTTHPTPPSSRPLQRETEGTIVRMNLAAIGRLTPGPLLFLELDFKPSPPPQKQNNICVYLLSVVSFLKRQANKSSGVILLLFQDETNLLNSGKHLNYPCPWVS